MGRPKSYDRDAELNKALALFLEHGFTALGIRAIEQATGLNKFAIRSEFGGKEGLWIAVLEAYVAAARKHLLADLENGGPDAIDTFFAKLATGEGRATTGHGCLIANAGVENRTVGSDRAAAIIRSYWLDLRDLLAQAMARGGISDAENQADEMLVAALGIHATNRIFGQPTAGAPLAEAMRAQLRTKLKK